MGFYGSGFLFVGVGVVVVGGVVGGGMVDVLVLVLEKRKNKVSKSGKFFLIMKCLCFGWLLIMWVDDEDDGDDWD